MRRPVIALVVVMVALMSASACLAACSGGSKSDGTTSTSTVSQPSTSTAPAPTTSTAPVVTTTTLAPVTDLDSWHDLPLMKGAKDIVPSDSELHYVAEVRADTLYEFYFGVMKDLGYKVISDAPSAPIHMTVYEKNGVRYTMFIVPPAGGDGSERQAFIVIQQS